MKQQQYYIKQLAILSRVEQAVRVERDKAFRRGFEDAGRGVPRKSPPYGFTDLKEAWRKGWDKRSKGLALTLGA